jgi:hypothetical protein
MMPTTRSATVVSAFVVSAFIVCCNASAAAAQGSCDLWKLAGCLGRFPTLAHPIRRLIS